jgi:AraC-like DNA-binding protein
VKKLFVNSVANITITKVFSANRLMNSPVGITIHRHNRNGWAIALKLQGKTIYTVGNKNVLSDSLHPVILPKGCDYSWVCQEPGECLIIEFDSDSKDSTLYSFEISDNSAIVNAFSKIEKSIHRQKPYHRLECFNHLYEILLILAKSTSKEPIHPKKHQILYPAIKYISENHFDGNITNPSLAEICGISTVYFRKTFESVYGISPIKYLHNFRIEKAKAILHSDYESIEQVARSVGYNSIYHFSKMFKQYTGKSPSEYAKASRN